MHHSVGHERPREALARARAASFMPRYLIVSPLSLAVFSSELSRRHFSGVENEPFTAKTLSSGTCWELSHGTLSFPSKQHHSIKGFALLHTP